MQNSRTTTFKKNEVRRDRGRVEGDELREQREARALLARARQGAEQGRLVGPRREKRWKAGTEGLPAKGCSRTHSASCALQRFHRGKHDFATEAFSKLTNHPF